MVGLSEVELASHWSPSLEPEEVLYVCVTPGELFWEHGYQRSMSEMGMGACK
jgi:hypothetical protein